MSERDVTTTPAADAVEQLAQRAELYAKDAPELARRLRPYLDAVALYGWPASECLDSASLKLAEMATGAAIERFEWALEELKDLASTFERLDELAREGGYQ